MKHIIKIGASEIKTITFVDYDNDGTVRDLRAWTLTPTLYDIGTLDVHKTGVAAGTISVTDASAGEFSFRNASGAFPTSGKKYSLRIKFVNNPMTYEKPPGEEIIFEVR